MAGVPRMIETKTRESWLRTRTSKKRTSAMANARTSPIANATKAISSVTGR